MARKKMCYQTSSELSHIWANGYQGAHGTYSTGDRTSVSVYNGISYLYSYRTKIAQIDLDKNVVLLSTDKYSNTTTKHQQEAEYATNHKEQIFIPNIEESTEANLNHMKKEIFVYAQKHIKARTRSYSNEIFALINNAKAYVKYLNIKVDWLKALEKVNHDIDDVIAFFLGLSEEEKIKAEKARKKAEREHAKAHKEAMKLIEDNKDFLEKYNAESVRLWRNGEKRNYRSDDYIAFRKIEEVARRYGLTIDSFNRGTFLRLSDDGENIETSHGAKIPTTVAKGLWRRLQRNESIDGMSLGHYTVNSLENGVLTVGCHQIPFSELEIIAELLGLEKLSA
ncbi:MAG: hypothetical protein EOL93_00580 [Epsilonproteobacteria bacterium]|nr:hypothetical protein [Campylobacterota bacterium]